MLGRDGGAAAADDAASGVVETAIRLSTPARSSIVHPIQVRFQCFFLTNKQHDYILCKQYMNIT